MLEVAIMSAFEKIILESASEYSISETLEEKVEPCVRDHDPRESKAPPILKLKSVMWVVGILSGRILSRDSLIAWESYT